eukprot:scaffold201724_cov32-Tisochrysis_lutea.AAC.2
MAPSSDSSTSKRSAGELRRRRWADARKKGRAVQAELSSLMSSPVMVDCIDCVRDDAARLQESIGQASCVWITGGNTFFLWHHMQRSGAAALIEQRVNDGGLFVGQSAGAIVAGESIATAYWKGWDDPQAAPEAVWNSESLGTTHNSHVSGASKSCAAANVQRKQTMGELLENASYLSM